MSNQPEPQIEIEEQPAVEGTEGTEYEGMSEEEIERAEFDKAVAEDPELDEPDPQEPEVKAEVEPEPEPEPEPPAPTGLEWLNSLPKEEQQRAQEFIDRQGQAIARLDQRVSSHLGQLQPAQRAITKLTAQLRDERERNAQLQPKDTGLEDRLKDFNAWVDEEYQEFPEEAAKLKTRFAESLDGIPQVLQTATPAEPIPMAGPDKSEEQHHLATAYSDWGERRYSPEFETWIARQAPETAALLNSAYASDNIALLDAFSRDNPHWVAPQAPEQFHSLRQAQHSPLFRGWAEGERLNPDMNVAALADYQRDEILTRFKTDLGVVTAELKQDRKPKVTELRRRRSAQLQDRNPGSRRLGVKPGQQIDLSTEEGQRAYFQQLVDADPDLN
jgi:hypothetical protein